MQKEFIEVFMGPHAFNTKMVSISSIAMVEPNDHYCIITLKEHRDGNAITLYTAMNYGTVKGLIQAYQAPQQQ